MKKRIAAISTIFCITCLSYVYAAQLRWEIPQYERLEIVRTASVKYFMDKNLIKNYGERNIINLTCYEKEHDGSRVKGDFTVYQKDEEKEIFKKLDEYYSDFKILTNGKFIVDEKYIMPNVRHLPAFPLKDIPQKGQWQENGEILFNNFPVPFTITFPVSYKLSEIKMINGTEIAVIDYSFLIKKFFKDTYVSGMPLKISGKNTGTLLWDIQNKRPYQMDDEYFIQFIFPDTKNKLFSAEFEMKIATRFTMYRKTDDEEKKKAIKDIEDVLPKGGGISVDDDKRGIVLRLGEVLFDFDSYRLKPQSVKSLDEAAKIIREKYSDREILVEGHTDNVGSADYNQRLSESRANSVAKYLKEKGLGDKLSYRGYGKERPLFDNSTVEGRNKNRRVEIIIKMK